MKEALLCFALCFPCMMVRERATGE